MIWSKASSDKRVSDDVTGEESNESTRAGLGLDGQEVSPADGAPEQNTGGWCISGGSYGCTHRRSWLPAQRRFAALGVKRVPVWTLAASRFRWRSFLVPTRPRQLEAPPPR